MAAQRLHGSCSCGRFRHIVELPSQHVGQAELRYDNSSASRQHSASPLALWLRVPLPWYTSATFAQFPDETHASIQRTFTSPYAPSTSSKFCGYCGTQLSTWNERTRDEAEHICLPVGSLLDEDQELLSALGFFGDSSDDDDTSAAAPSRSMRSEPHARGAPRFEDIVRNTSLGRLRQQRGRHSGNGVQVEWEVTEWTEGDGDGRGHGDGDGDSGSATPNKRKIDELEAGDAEMRSS